jgi:uncharacterized protein YkwD
MRRVLLALLFAFAVPAIAALPARAAGCANADVTPTADNLTEVRSATVCLLNKHRRAKGLHPLRNNSRLQAAATRFSQRMVRERFFDHTAPDGTTFDQRIEAAGYGAFVALAENIAWGSGTRATPTQIVTGWMRSSGHRRNILDASLREIGVGVVPGAPQDAVGGVAGTYTTDFGSRR